MLVCNSVEEEEEEEVEEVLMRAADAIAIARVRPPRHCYAVAKNIPYHKYIYFLFIIFNINIKLFSLCVNYALFFRFSANQKQFSYYL